MNLKLLYIRDTVDLTNVQIQNIMKNIKYDPIGFRYVVNELHRVFGDPKNYKKTLFATLISYPTLDFRNNQQITSFQADLHKYVANSCREGSLE